MIRYTKQFDESSCGPISVINAIKWVGVSINRKSNLSYFRKIAKCDKHGTAHWDLDLLLSVKAKPHLNIKKYIFVTWSLIKKHLQKDGIVILRHGWDKYSDAGHYTLITHLTSKKVGVVNYFHDGPAYRLIDQETLKKIISVVRPSGKKAICWLLSKPQK